MSNLRRAAILKLAANAHEMDMDVLQGKVVISAETISIGGQDLIRWAQQLVGQEIVLVAGSLADDRQITTRTCRKCGRDYAALECDYCARQRKRIRGR